MRKGKNIYKRKDGRWEGRVITGRLSDGRAKYQSVYARSYTELTIKMEQRRQKLDENKKMQQLMDYSEKKRVDTPTVKELSECWLTSIYPSLKESSYNRYYNQIHLNILPYFGTIAVSAITTVMMQEYASSLLTGKNSLNKRLSPKTVRDILSICKRIFTYADSCGFSTICNFSNIYLRVTEPQLTVLTPEEQRRLIQYLAVPKETHDLGIMLVLFTGLRIGEVCALKWSNIHLKEARLMVDSSMQRIQNHSKEAQTKTKIVIDSPKSLCSIRSIPLPDYLVKYLAPHEQRPDTFLLTGTNNFIEPRSLENIFKRTLQSVGLRDMKFHALRHTFATRCVESGFDIKSLSEILGHATVNITLNRYVHPSESLKLENMEKLEGLFTVK